MVEETLLSDLCSSCNVNQPKYRCPGCAARTCSLPCYKRHQQRAQCTGKRDPTKFVKKSQLATPAGIDHDFNFLTGIERDLKKAESDVQERLPSVSGDPRRSAPKGLVTDKRLADAGVTVFRAPKGLTRQRENKTHLSGKRHIVWTVEWLHEDKTRLLSEFSETQPVGEAYRNLIGETSQKSSRKRKREAQENKRETQDVAPVDEVRAGVLSDDEKSELLPSGRRSPSVVEESGASVSAASTTEAITSAKVEGHDGSSSHVDEQLSKSATPRHHYFLLKPRTTANRPVLIPIQPTSTLSASLRGRAILEYPTIYVLTRPDPPAEKFMLEDEYSTHEREEQKEMEDIMTNHPETLRKLAEEQAEAAKDDEVDSEKVLHVLKQDLGILDQSNQ
ncbi:hypothetical protein BU24DRAFT_458654 [Aaosphaeria arxii CBS 175.79]|uniref:HIT-type domain-containing protein n=1 Tax=Aaosphaeria arxii CBS 175.79 TaxID=1450172 RepID=A0A6A5Y112_9PLEO|nr:uncharacterized protein BU24DRAFT_458654 [Aaosphaeria arxii CBS 175.79]KAF2018926.1 hypothetical protein BU24DRAFT_458654 [Aaosphaeria arxii CBS 175.79]